MIGYIILAFISGGIFGLMGMAMLALNARRNIECKLDQCRDALWELDTWFNDPNGKLNEYPKEEIKEALKE